MANFASIATTLEGALANELTLARTNQGIWEWYNALQRIMSANRFTGTPRMDGPVLLTATDRDIETGAVVIFGFLIDNSMAAEDLYLLVYNVNAVTEGTTDATGLLFAPRNAITTYVMPNGLTHDTAFTISAALGTTVGQEAGTAPTTFPTVISVYTE